MGDGTAAEDFGGDGVVGDFLRLDHDRVEGGFLQVENVACHGGVAAGFALVFFADADDVFKQLDALAGGEGLDAGVEAQLKCGGGHRGDPLRVGAGEGGAVEVEISAGEEIHYLVFEFGVGRNCCARNTTKSNGEFLHKPTCPNRPKDGLLFFVSPPVQRCMEGHTGLC
jgi:hypothetical protein